MKWSKRNTYLIRSWENVKGIGIKCKKTKLLLIFVDNNDKNFFKSHYFLNKKDNWHTALARQCNES